jgi:hypothetical protein
MGQEVQARPMSITLCATFCAAKERLFSVSLHLELLHYFLSVAELHTPASKSQSTSMNHHYVESRKIPSWLI